MSVSDDSARMTFWDHLDALRAVLVKVVAVVVAFSIVAFLFKEELFSILLFHICSFLLHEAAATAWSQDCLHFMSQVQRASINMQNSRTRY